MTAHRKDWIVSRLRELVGVFAIHCGGFAVMDNHLHLLLRLDFGPGPSVVGPGGRTAMADPVPTP